MHGDLGSGRVLTARQKLRVEEVVVDVLANENHLALAGLVGFKGLVAGAEVDLFVHALEHKLRVACIQWIKNKKCHYCDATRVR